MSLTLGQITAAIRTNLAAATGSQSAIFYDDAELKQYANEAFMHYALLMIQEGAGWFQKIDYFSLISNQEAYNMRILFPDFIDVASLERVLPYGTKPLKYNVRRFTTNFTTGIGQGTAYVPTYRKSGNNIILEPFPNFSETGGPNSGGIKIFYNYLPVLPSVDGDTYDSNFPDYFQNVLVLYGTIAALEAKDGIGGVSDIQSFRDRLAKLEMSFMDSLQDTEYPDHVEYTGVNYSNFFF